jgi:beta-catenin-like protein 1
MNTTNSTISSTLDRITSKAIEAGSTKKDLFIPSSTWQGAKPGYVFRTSTSGTGYYLDHSQSNEINEISHSNDKRPRDEDGLPEAEKRRKVRFGQDEIKTIPAKQPTSAKLLLEQAEREQEEQGRKSLDLSRGKSSLKSIVANLEKSIAKNQMQRSEFSSSPEKFMDSEVALYEEIAQLNDLATSVEYYRYFVELGAVDQLVVLLGHENVDVALAVIRLFVELLDPTLFTGAATDDGLATMVTEFLGVGHEKHGGLAMSIANVMRFREDEEEELKGIDDVLNLVENLLDLDQTGMFSQGSSDMHESHSRSVVSVIASSSSLVSYLLTKLADKDLSKWNASLRLHASEVLSAIFQHDDARCYLENLNKLPLVSSSLMDDSNTNPSQSLTVDGMECLLQCIAVYRKVQPESDEECEYIENIFDTLAASLLSEMNIQCFLDGEGIELMLRCINERVHSGFGSLKVLYFALTGLESFQSKCCKVATETFIEAGGFKVIFPIFMGRKAKMPQPSQYCDAGNIELLKKYAAIKENGKQGTKSISNKLKQVIAANKDWYQSIEGFSVHIIYALTKHIDDTSPNDSKARLLAKFIENDGEKCDRAVELCLKYDLKMRQAEFNYYKSDEAEEAEMNGVDVDLAALNSKLQGGGDVFHRLSAIIAFISVNSKRCHRHILEQLHTQNSGIGIIKTGLDEFVGILHNGHHRDELVQFSSQL